MTKFYTKTDSNNQQLQIEGIHFDGHYSISVSKGESKDCGSSWTTVLFQDLNTSFKLLKGRKSAKKLATIESYTQELFNHIEQLPELLNYESDTALKDFFNNYIANNPIKW